MLREIDFKSTNGRDKVYGWVYVPAKEPIGVIQLIHGFGEHSRRYLEMITAFMAAGYIVAANDHVGHGKTALENDTWGDWGDAGYTTMRDDCHLFAQEVQELYPELPYFVYGHSMGSVILRDYMTVYGEEIDGAILCGTTSADAFPISEVKKKLEAEVKAGKGDEADDKYLQELMSGLFARIPEEMIEIGNEWICHIPDVQRDHAEDPFNAFTKPINKRSVLYFIEMIEAVEGIQWAKKVPTDLPVYNICGDQDPVGDYARGVYQCSNWLAETGHDVETKAYTGLRHEIHNYEEEKYEVYKDILNFVNVNNIIVLEDLFGDSLFGDEDEDYDFDED